MVMSSIICIGLAAAIGSFYAKNKLIPAIVWNIAFSFLSYGLILFLFKAIR